MARNEVEVLFDRLTQRHIDKSIELTLQQAEFIRHRDLDQVDAVGELIKQQTGRLRFLGEYTVEVTSTLRSKGIDILEEVEDIKPVQLPKPEAVLEPVTIVPKLEVAEQEEKIPETFITPDGIEFFGETGKLLAFLFHRNTFKDRFASANHMYGKQDQAACRKITSLINYVKKDESSAFKHGVRIETKPPSPKERRQGTRAEDRAVLVKEPQQTEVEVVEITAPLQAAVLADVMLTAYDRNPEGLQQSGVNLGQAGIRELQDIRQQGGIIKLELKSRLMRECQDLLSRFLADASTVYDELAKNPDDKDILIALTHFAPLAQSGERMFDQLFKEL